MTTALDLSTPEGIDRLLALCEAATPGPWGHDLNGTVAEIDGGEWGETVCLIPEYSIEGADKSNAELIAAARTTLPLSLAELKAARARVRELEDGLERAIECIDLECGTGSAEEYNQILHPLARERSAGEKGNSDGR